MQGPLVDALTAEYAAVSAAVHAAGVDFAVPTPLPGWSVRDLLFHVAQDARRARADLTTRPDGPVDVDFVSYWQTYDEQPSDLDSDVTSREAAWRYPDDRLLLDDWAWWTEDTRAALARRSRSDLVLTQGLVLTAEDFVTTLVVEVTVHGVDLAAALDRPAWSSLGGLAATRTTLLGLLGAPLPAGLDWTDSELLVKGTGRRPLESADRAALGALADRFPLLR